LIDNELNIKKTHLSIAIKYLYRSAVNTENSIFFMLQRYKKIGKSRKVDLNNYHGVINKVMKSIKLRRIQYLWFFKSSQIMKNP